MNDTIKPSNFSFRPRARIARKVFATTGVALVLTVSGIVAGGTFLGGCGAGQKNSSSTRTEKRGSVSLAIVWPTETAAPSRRIPANTNSIVATLTRLDGTVPSVVVGGNSKNPETVDRPAGVTTSTIKFGDATFPYDAYVLTVVAFSGANGTGEPLASAKIPVTIGNPTETVTVTLAENVKFLNITGTDTIPGDADPYAIFSGESKEYRVTGYTVFTDDNVDNDIVALFPTDSTVTWSSEDTAKFTVDDTSAKTVGTGEVPDQAVPIKVTGVQSTARISKNLKVTYSDQTNTVSATRGLIIRPKISDITVATSTLDQDGSTTISAIVLSGTRPGVLYKVERTYGGTTYDLTSRQNTSFTSFYYVTSPSDNPVPSASPFINNGTDNKITFYAPRHSIAAGDTDLSMLTTLNLALPAAFDVADDTANGTYTVTAWPEEDDTINTTSFKKTASVFVRPISFSTVAADTTADQKVTLGSTVTLKTKVLGIVDPTTTPFSSATPPSANTSGPAGVYWEITDSRGEPLNLSGGATLNGSVVMIRDTYSVTDGGTVTNSTTDTNSETATFTPPTKAGDYYVRATSRTDTRRHSRVIKITVPTGNVNAVIK